MNVMKRNSIISSGLNYFRTLYGLDARSLALFRILVALVVMVDLAKRYGDANVLYSDAGILPRISAIHSIAPERWSLFFINGSPEFSKLVILCGMIAAGLMMVGWRTCAATIALWVIVVSVQARNSHLTYGADTLIRLSLFWGMFLPLGARWSFDSQRAAKPVATTFASVATLALIAQSAFMYFFTALLKDGIHWRQDFDAVYYALGMRDLSTWLGEWIFLSAPKQFFTAITVGTLWMEFTVPILLLLPVRTGWPRMIAIALVFGLHLGIGSTMSVGLFPAISIASILVVLPSGFWAYVSNSRLVGSRMRGRPSTSGDEVIAEESPISGHQPVFAADSHVLGILPHRSSESPVTPRFAANAVCALAVLLGLLWNISMVSPSYALSEPVRRTAVVTGLYQDWAMFAPNPRAATNWFIFEGELTSGEKVDLMEPVMTGEFSFPQAPVWDQSEDVLLNNERWRKYFQAIRSREGDGLQLAGYACRNWNAEDRGQNRLETVTLTFASAATLPNSQRADPAFVEVGSWVCD